jgi:hypothetical protein
LLQHLATQPLPSGPPFDAGSANQPVGPKLPGPEQRLTAAARKAIFQNRHQLLDVISDDKTRLAICTPAPNDSYHLFQSSLHEELDILWDLDIYSSGYHLSDKQHTAVKACTAEMEKYEDNFELWRKFNGRPQAR